MDDLTMLRSLGRELEHEPPATLVRHRQRLIDTAAGARAGGRRHWTAPRGWPMLALVGVVTAALIITPAVLLTAQRTGQQRPAGTAEPASGAAKAVNLLLIGTDRRAARSRSAAQAARSDIIMVLHLPADRRSATLVSIPRDTVVRIPACRTPGGETAPTRTGVIGTAFTEGGLACTLKTVESVTGARMDHGVAVDFAGFQGLVDALGGVEMTIPHAMADPAAGLRLRPGKQVLNGDQALAYVRARRTVGHGSDLVRIQRQQQFMTALAARARQRLTDPRKLAAFLETAARAVTTQRLDAKTALSIARSLKDTPAGALRTVTVPIRPALPHPQRVIIDQAPAEKIFATLRQR